MQQVTAHITVIAQGAARAPDAGVGGHGAPQAGADALPEAQGFAQMLAAQIGAKPLPEAAPAAVANPAKVLVDSVKNAVALAKQDESGEAPRDAVIQQVLDTAANLPLPQLIQQLLPQARAEHVARCCDLPAEVPNIKSDLPLELQSLVQAQTKPQTTIAVTPANPDAEAAKFAGVQQLVHETEGLVNEEAVKPESMPVATAAVTNRAEPAQVHANNQVRVDVPVGEKGWDQAVAQRVVWLATNNQQTAQLHVTPPNLGPVEIRITINNDQASAIFVSPHANVREALESALPRLREMFADSGLTLGNVNVASEQQRQQAQHGQNKGRGRGGNPEGDVGMEIEGVEGVRQGVATIRTGPEGLVDLYA